MRSVFVYMPSINDNVWGMFSMRVRSLCLLNLFKKFPKKGRELFRIYRKTMSSL